MKKITICFLLFLTTITLIAQNDKEELPYATVNFVRGYARFLSACIVNIEFPNQRMFTFPHNTIVKYKVYSEGDIVITQEGTCQGIYTPVVSKSQQITIPVKRGNEYFITFESWKIKQSDVAEISKLSKYIRDTLNFEENLDYPILKESVNNIRGSQGTCFLINNEGFFITNYHCVENAKEIYIKGIDGDFTTKYGASIIATDPSNDLALVKISNNNVKFSTPPFSIRANGVNQAERVYALGFPKAKTMGDELKITEGIISSKSGLQGDISKFQISAAVNPGNSGGPLIDENGNLIGVIYAKSNIADAAGYAVKASYLELFLKNIDSFNFPDLTNTLKELPFTDKIAALKKYVYIIETK